MKYLDARNMNSLKNGVMEFLDLSEEEMEDLFLSMLLNREIELHEWVTQFLVNHTGNEELESIQMFHLSRRLNGTDLRANFNLKQLLIEDSPISDFFGKYNVTFKKECEHIELYYKGRKVDLEKFGNSESMYIRWRLGNEKEFDYCINGFAFRSYLESEGNGYYSSLERCPEIIDIIGRFLGISEICNDYYNNSKYYCIEYIIPMSEVIFDGYNPLMTNQEKTLELLKLAILRLFDEMNGANFVSNHNQILRLSDDSIIKEDWVVNFEELSRTIK